MADAKALVENTNRLLEQARKKCRGYDSDACESADRFEVELISSTTLYLELIEKQGGDPSEARRLLASALSTDVGALLKSLDALRARGISSAESQELVVELLNRVLANDNPQALVSAIQRIIEDTSDEERGRWIEAAAQLVGTLSRSGLSEAEGAKMVAGLIETTGKDPERMRTLLGLVQSVRNPKVLAIWNASLSAMLGHQSIDPERAKALQSELGKREPDPNAVLRVILLMKEAEQKALARFGAVIAEAQEKQRADESRDGLLRTTRNTLVILSSELPGSDDCGGPTEVFRLAIEHGLTESSLDGIRTPIDVPNDKFDAALAEATARCRRDNRVPVKWVPEVSGACEGVLAIQLVRNGDIGKAKGTLQYAVPLDKGASSLAFQEVRSEPFALGCGAVAHTEQIKAASDLLFTMQQRSWVVARGLLPQGIVERYQQLKPVSRWNSLILSGLPQLSDNNPGNDGSGFLLAGMDLSLLVGASASMAYGYGMYERYDSTRNSHDRSVANGAATVAILGFSALAFERIFSAILYEP